MKAARGRRWRAVFVGEPAVWRRAGWTPALGGLADTRLGLKAPAYGRPTAETGRASFAAVKLAARLAARRLVDAVVTAPIAKSAWLAAGAGFPDHTEFFRAETGRDAQMVLGAPRLGLWCVPATRHVPLCEVPRRLNLPVLRASALALREAMRLLGKKSPRLGLCALNPHAGEDGILGGEERRLLAPAARTLRLKGPIPADTAWRVHLKGELDGLVALYHDQALIPLKTAAGLEIVNWTVGLPYVRTSPGHGTGFDVAGTKRVSPDATLAAAGLAARLVWA